MKNKNIFKNNPLKVNNKTPLYLQIKKHIISSIENENLSPGDLLPAEHQLCQILHVSRNTIRKALKDLCDEGYLYTLKGSGTYVTDTTLYHSTKIKTPIYAMTALDSPIIYEIEVLQLSSLPCSYIIAKNLNLVESENVFFLKKLYSLKNQPLFYTETYLPLGVIKDFTQYDFTKIDLYALINTNNNAKIKSIKRTYQGKLSTHEDEKVLNVDKTIPIIHENIIAYNKYHVPIETSKIIYNGNLNIITDYSVQDLF